MLNSTNGKQIPPVPKPTPIIPRPDDPVDKPISPKKDPVDKPISPKKDIRKKPNGRVTCACKQFSKRKRYLMLYRCILRASCYKKKMLPKSVISKNLTQEALRAELGFDKLLVSDSSHHCFRRIGEITIAPSYKCNCGKHDTANANTEHFKTKKKTRRPLRPRATRISPKVSK